MRSLPLLLCALCASAFAASPVVVIVSDPLAHFHGLDTTGVDLASPGVHRLLVNRDREPHDQWKKAHPPLAHPPSPALLFAALIDLPNYDPEPFGACTLAATGNWRVVTWSSCGASYPQSGDTATLADTFTVTIPSSETDTVGSSPTSDAGTPAVQCSTSTGTGVLVVNGSLTYRGPMRRCTDTAVGPGGSIIHDSSLSAPTTYTDLVIGSTTSNVTSAANPFSSSSEGRQFVVESGAGCTVGSYIIRSVATVTASVTTDGWTLASMGTAGSTCGGRLLANYSWQQINSSVLRLNGTVGNRVAVGIAAGSGNTGPFMGASETTAHSGQIVATYADFRNCGYLTHNAASGSAATGGYCIWAHQDGGDILDITNSTVSLSAPIGVQFGAADTFRFGHLNITNELAANNGARIGVYFGNATTSMSVAKTTGTREILHSYFDNAGLFWFAPFATSSSCYLLGLNFKDNFQYGWSGNPGVTYAGLPWNGNAGNSCVAEGEWLNNLIWHTGQTGQTPSWKPPIGFLGSTYVLYDDYATLPPSGSPVFAPSTSNYHPVVTQDGPITFDRWIWEGWNPDGVSKSALVEGSPHYDIDFDVIFQRNWWKLRAGGTASGWSVEGYNSACSLTPCPRITVKNSLFNGGWVHGYPSESAGVGYETGSVSPMDVKAGMMAGTYSNIFTLPSDATGSIEGPIATGFSAPSGFYSGTHDYNFKFHLTGSVSGLYKQSGTASLYTNPPGGNDQSGNPQLADTSREFLTWCQTLNGADATWLDCKAHFALRGTDAEDTRYNVPALITWVLAGAATNNSATWSSGKDGLHVGPLPPPAMFPMPSSIPAPRVR